MSVRYMHPRRKGPPGTVYHWKPSPRLRRLGWRNLMLGSDYDVALVAAARRNLEVLGKCEAAVIGEVYFIAALRGPIKIGWSGNPEQRLVQLQLASPTKLRIIATVAGPIDLEREYHERLATHRLEGEWFAPHQEVLEAIREIRRRTSDATAERRRTAKRPKTADFCEKLLGLG